MPRWLWPAGCLAIALVALVPGAQAQPQPKVYAELSWAMDHEMVLPEDGRGDMGLEVKVWGEDFSCLKPMAYYVEFVVESGITKWAGASIVPSKPIGPFVFDKVNADGRIQATDRSTEKATLNMVWDLDSVPPTNTVTEYVVKPELQRSNKGEESGPCVQDPPITEPIRSGGMVVRMPDRPTEAEPTDSSECEYDPWKPGCQPDEPSPPPTTPGPPLAFVFLVLTMAVAASRRSRSRRK